MENVLLKDGEEIIKKEVGRTYLGACETDRGLMDFYTIHYLLDELTFRPGRCKHLHGWSLASPTARLCNQGQASSPSGEKSEKS